MNEVVQVISTVGFPIVACGALFYYITKMNDVHKAETDKMSDAINNNTLVIQKLLDRMGGE